MAREYNVNEGNQIGYVPAEFGTDLSLQQKKIVAGANVTKGQVVVVSGDMKVSPSAGASDAVIGVAMFDAKAGEPVAVETEGLFKLTAGATITAGDKVASAADGKVGKLGTGGTKIGIALSSATSDEDVYVKFSI